MRKVKNLSGKFVRVNLNSKQLAALNSEAVNTAVMLRGSVMAYVDGQYGEFCQITLERSLGDISMAVRAEKCWEVDAPTPEWVSDAREAAQL